MIDDGSGNYVRCEMGLDIFVVVRRSNLTCFKDVESAASMLSLVALFCCSSV